MNKCKYCGSENLYLENKTNRNIMELPQVALKCANCGKWLKWCPKEERKYYLGEFKKLNQRHEIQIEELQKQLFNKEKDLELIANSNSGLSRMVTEKNMQVDILNIALKLACEDLFFTKFPYLNKEDNPKHEFNGLLNHYKTKAKELLNESNND